MKSTKIIATLGPATETEERIQQLINAGVDVFRLNCSHGQHEYLQKLIAHIRSIDEEKAILLDTKGPEIRSAEVDKGSITLEDGKEIIVTNEEIVGTPEKICIRYHQLSSLEKGNTILIDDGLIELKVLEKKGEELCTKIITGGELGNKKTVSIIGHNVDLPFLSEQDKKDILFGIEQEVDFIAASFVRSVQEILELKEFLEQHNAEHIRIIAKIEHPKALDEIDAIIHEAGGVMVARGDLGVETPLEKVPALQKMIIEKCNQLGRPVIVATQMLESMKEHSRPTRAEVADVANAILQGTDAIMLSAETAIGKYPIKSVQAMVKIAKEYDGSVQTRIEDTFHKKEYLERHAVSMFVTQAAAQAAEKLRPRVIFTPTETGHTARKVSRFRPKCPIIAITKSKQVLRQLQITWGVQPILLEEEYAVLDEMVEGIISFAHKQKIVDTDDRVVMTAGHLLAQSGVTNILEIYRVSSILNKMKSTKGFVNANA